MFDKYYTIIEAGNVLGIHPETVKRLCREEKLPATKFHYTWLKDPKELEHYSKNYKYSRGVR